MNPVDPKLPPTRGWKPVVFAVDQPEYRPLPAVRSNATQGYVITAWALSWRERVRVLFTGRLYLTLFTFGRSLSPSLVSTHKPTLLPDGSYNANETE